MNAPKNLSAKEIVPNLNLLDKAGRILREPHRIDIRCPVYIQVIEYEDPTIPQIDPGYKRVRVSERFYDKLEEVLKLLNPDWIMPLSGFFPLYSPSGDWDLSPIYLETANLLCFSGMALDTEREKQKAAVTVRRCGSNSNSSGDQGALYDDRTKLGNALIEHGVFDDWEEIGCYAQIHDIMVDPKVYYNYPPLDKTGDHEMAESEPTDMDLFLKALMRMYNIPPC